MRARRSLVSSSLNLRKQICHPYVYHTGWRSPVLEIDGSITRDDLRTRRVYCTRLISSPFRLVHPEGKGCKLAKKFDVAHAKRWGLTEGHLPLIYRGNSSEISVHKVTMLVNAGCVCRKEEILLLLSSHDQS